MPPIEVTLRNDGAEVQGKVETQEDADLPNLKQVAPMQQTAYVYFVPMNEDAGELRRAQSWNGMIDEKQITPGTYRILAFDHKNTEIGSSKVELLRRFQSKGVVVELSAG